MLTFWEVTGLVGTFLVLLSGGGALVWKGIRQHGDSVQGAVESLRGLVSDFSRDGNGETDARFAQLERRMEQLEQDALSYLRKGSQRYEQARRREARLTSIEDEDDPGEGVTERDREQLELALQQGAHNGESEHGFPSLESVRARIQRG